MASALAKLFKKRLSKQILQDQRQKQDSSPSAATPTASSAQYSRNVGRFDTQPYLTVGSLNSAASSTSHFPFSSMLSLDSGSGLASPTAPIVEPGHPYDNGSSTGTQLYDVRPRAASMSSQSMLRGLSDGMADWRKSGFAEGEVHVDQFGGLLQPPACESSASRDGHERQTTAVDEIDIHPIYSSLTQRDDLKLDWSMARLVLLPDKYDVLGVQELNCDEYIALYALQPSNLFKDQFVSVRSTLPIRQDNKAKPWHDLVVTATLEAETRSVHLIVSRKAAKGRSAIRIERSIPVLSETTIYHSLPKQGPLGRSSASTKMPSHNSKRPTLMRRERARVRILSIAGEVIPRDFVEDSDMGANREGQPRSGTKLASEGRKDVLENDSIAFPLNSPPMSSTDSPQPQSPLLAEADGTVEACLIPARRHFLADFAFLLDPPDDLRRYREALRVTFTTIRRAAKDFTTAYVYVSGFDAYNVSRIRRGILAKAWQTFESIINRDDNKEGDIKGLLMGEGRSRLLLLLENVVMGHCHGKIYSSIRDVYQEADEAVDHVICTYQELNVTLADLGVNLTPLCRRPALLEKAIFIAKHLGESDEDLEHVLKQRNVDQIKSLAGPGNLYGNDSCSETDETDNVAFTLDRRRARIRTPLDVLDVFHATIEEIGLTIDKVQKADRERKSTAIMRSSLGTDELLPILAYVLIHAGRLKLVSLLYYTRQFGLSDAISSKLNWALVTHDAVIEFLRSDPLHLCSVLSPRSLKSLSTSPPVCPQRGVGPRVELTLADDARVQKASPAKDYRARRISLPANVAMASLHPDIGASTSNKSHARTSSELPPFALSSSACDSTDQSDVEEGSFKVPGRPASAYGLPSSHSRALSSLDAVGEDGALTSHAHYLSRSTSSGRETGSMRRKVTTSGSGDLLIRPQIVVRPRRSQLRSATSLSSDSARSESRERPMTADILGRESWLSSSQLQSMKTTGTMESRRMARAGSEDMPAEKSIGKDAAILRLPHTRRKSMDSWAAFGFFGGTPAPAKTTSEYGMPSASAGDSISPTSSSQGHSSTATLASPPTTWLSSWLSEGYQKGRGGGSETGGSRPASVMSSDIGLSHQQLNTWSFPALPSSNSNVALVATTSDNTISDTTTTTTATSTNRSQSNSSSYATRKPASVRSDSSSSHHSHHYSGHRSDDAHPPQERRHRPARSRLLSLSRPSEPRVSSESAEVESFNVGGRFAGQERVMRRHPLSPTLPPNTPASSSKLYDDMRGPVDQQTPRCFPSGESGHGFFTSSIFPTIHVPTPVDERTDPLSLLSEAS